MDGTVIYRFLWKFRAVEEHLSTLILIFSEKCACNDNFHGPACEFAEECEFDYQCENDGKCIDIQSTTYPTKQCFCKDGFFGGRCQKISKFTRKDIEQDVEYNTKKVNEDYTMKWKVMQETEEIRVILKVGLNNPSFWYRITEIELFFSGQNQFICRFGMAAT